MQSASPSSSSNGQQHRGTPPPSQFFERTPSRFLQPTASSSSRTTRVTPNFTAAATATPLRRTPVKYADPTSSAKMEQISSSSSGSLLHPSIERIVTDSRRLLVAEELDSLRFLTEEQRFAAVGMQGEGQHATTVLSYLLQAAQREKAKRMKLLLAAKSTARRETATTPVSSRTSTPVRGREVDATMIRATSEERRRVAQTKRDRMMQYSPSASTTSLRSAPKPVASMQPRDRDDGVVAKLDLVMSQIPNGTSSGATTPRRGVTPTVAKTPTREAGGATSPGRFGASAVAGRTAYPSAAGSSSLTFHIPSLLPPAATSACPSVGCDDSSRSPSPRDPLSQTRRASDVTPTNVIAHKSRAFQVVPPLVLPTVPKLKLALSNPPASLQNGDARPPSAHGDAVTPRSRTYLRGEGAKEHELVPDAQVTPAPVVRAAPRAVSPHRTAKWLDDFLQRLKELDLTPAMWRQLSPAEQEELFVFWRLSQLQRNVILAKFDSIANSSGR